MRVKVSAAQRSSPGAVADVSARRADRPESEAAESVAGRACSVWPAGSPAGPKGGEEEGGYVSDAEQEERGR